ncbi:hypothetical protein Tco_0913256 [Tanacetum coccineum]
MATLADKAILSGADKAYHHVEKAMYGFWRKAGMEANTCNNYHSQGYHLRGLCIGLVNHKVAKELWARNSTSHARIFIDELGKSSCMLYDEFDTFAYKIGTEHYFAIWRISLYGSDAIDENYVNSLLEPTLSSRPTKVEVPKELPKVSMVNTSLKKLKHHLAGFDVVCLKLETQLLNKKDFVAKEIYDKLFKSFTTLEKHCISLEVDTQLNQEIFQRDNSVSNQSAPSFDQLFELNELKAQSQEKDTVIKKLKERNKSLSENMNEDKVKKNIEEIETVNIKLDHRVSKLIAENEHLKQTYKQLYDSIKPT